MEARWTEVMIKGMYSDLDLIDDLQSDADMFN